MDKEPQTRPEIEDLCRRAHEAQLQIAAATQGQVDHICAAMVRAGFRAARHLAEMAVSETGMGRLEDKLLKDEFSTRDLWESIRGLKTVGVISYDRRRKVSTIAEPMGVVAGIIPVTASPGNSPEAWKKRLLSFSCISGKGLFIGSRYRRSANLFY